MDYSTILLLLLIVPFGATLLMAILPAKMPHVVFETIHMVSLLGVLTTGTLAVLEVMGGNEIFALDIWLHLDSLGTVFIALIALIGLCTGWYSIKYIRNDVEEGKLPATKVKQYYVLFNLFVFTMLLATISNNLVVTWIAVEATTLSTVFLVGIYNDKFSLEAAWKYIIVCTVGVAFGLYGTILVYSNAVSVLADTHQASFWTSILPHAAQFDPALMRIAFVFAVIGFGTKAGLFPMHTWLPDAHSEAPSPVSAFLSGVLLKCAVMVILRFYTFVLPSTGIEFPRMILLIVGILSIAVSAFLIYSQHDLKRKLAYHSVENIGIIVLCIGIGGTIGIAAALLHCLAHGFTKALLFLISGDLLQKYGTRDLQKIQGILQVAPFTAVIFIISLFGLVGLPPFAMFFSEIAMFVSGVLMGYIPLLIIVGIALAIVLAACMQIITGSVFGAAPEGMEKKKMPISMLLPELALLAVIVGFAVMIPGPVFNDIESAAAKVSYNEGGPLHEVEFFNFLGEANNSLDVTE